MVNIFLHIIVCEEIWCRYYVDIKMFILLIVIVYMCKASPRPSPLRHAQGRLWKRVRSNERWKWVR